MVTAPTVVDPRDWNYEYNDREEMIFKQNALNEYRYNFSVQLAAMCAELDIEFQYVEETRIDITQKSGLVATALQQVNTAKNSVDQSKSHIDQQKELIDTTAGQVSQNAQQVAQDKQTVADDKQAAADSAQAAGESAGQAEQSKQAAYDLYGDLDAVNTAKTQSQQAAQTATQQAGLAESSAATATEQAGIATNAAQQANVDVNTAINTVVDGAPSTLNTLNKLAAAIADNPNFHTDLNDALADKLSMSGGALTGDLAIDKPGTRHLWFRENGAPRGLLYAQSFGNDVGMRLRTYIADGSVSADLGLKESGDIEAIVGRFKGDGSGLTGTAPLRATGTTQADVGLSNVDDIASAEEDTPNTIARRSNGGDLFARLFRSTYASTNSDIAAFFTTRTIGGDWMRPSTPDQVRDALGGNPTTISGATANNVSGANHTHNVSTTASRDSSNTALLLNAKAMYDHKRSSDHDDRYYTKGQVDSAVAGAVPSDFNTKGSYAVLRVSAVDDTLPGDTRVGSNLTVVRLDGLSGYTNDQGIPYSVTGTWKLMSGRCTSISGGNNQTRTGIWVKL